MAAAADTGDAIASACCGFGRRIRAGGVPGRRMATAHDNVPEPGLRRDRSFMKNEKKTAIACHGGLFWTFACRE
ncbi:hypothetical protein [Paraburkholderia kururiensis]|jgi:hypothetical protein|uniref:hypothetical protein n=1 Tax=Paraburkholderia kururiensis TaxID=984307 RepID=UPI0003470874|nr:hypothetical protein [Paraburkholderia kururiensis]